MTPHEAKTILMRVKRQVRDRKVFEAIDVAITALCWHELQMKDSEITEVVEEVKEVQDETVA